MTIQTHIRLHKPKTFCLSQRLQKWPHASDFISFFARSYPNKKWHSFLIAFTASRQGIPDYIIKLLSHWSSLACLNYKFLLVEVSYSSEHEETVPPVWTPQFRMISHLYWTQSINLLIIHPSINPVPSSLTLHPLIPSSLTLHPLSHDLHPFIPFPSPQPLPSFLHPFRPQPSLWNLNPSLPHYHGSPPSISCNKSC